MMIMNENTYLRIDRKRCWRNSNHRNGFHLMITEGYLHDSTAKSVLSRITEAMTWKLNLSPLKEVNEGRSIHSSFQSDLLRIVSVFLKLKGYSLIVARSSPPRALSPRSIDCSFGKSESSNHPFSHSQTQPNAHDWMHIHQFWLIVVEEDLWIQTIQSVKLINENDEA